VLVLVWSNWDLVGGCKVYSQMVLRNAAVVEGIGCYVHIQTDFLALRSMQNSDIRETIQSCLPMSLLVLKDNVLHETSNRK